MDTDHVHRDHGGGHGEVEVHKDQHKGLHHCNNNIQSYLKSINLVEQTGGVLHGSVCEHRRQK